MRSLRSLPVLAAGFCFAAGAALAAEPAAVPQIRSVRDAVSVALEHAPAIRAAEAKRGARGGDRRQAALRPNPDFTVEAENFAGSGVYRGGRALETTVGIAQKLELGGKWTARVELAEAGLSLSRRDWEAARLDAVRDATGSYAEAVAARRAVALESERLRLAEEVLRIVRERVAGGREPLVQARKAEVARAGARLALERARREAAVAERALATALGQQRVELVADEAWFEAIGPAPSGPADPAGVTANPDYRRWEAALAESRAAVAVERAAAVPDLTLGGGIRRFSDTDDTAIVLSLSIPIPVANRNQGAIERARSELTRTEVEARRARLALASSLAEAEEGLAGAWRAADALHRTVVPAAAQAFAFAREGYAAGKFPFLDVLDAERTLFDARAQLDQALKELHLRRAELARLTASATAVVGEEE